MKLRQKKRDQLNKKKKKIRQKVLKLNRRETNNQKHHLKIKNNIRTYQAKMKTG